MASSDLTSIARVKDFLKLTSTADDGLLQALVTRYSLWVKKRIGRDVTLTAYDIRVNGWGGNVFPFPQYPAVTVDLLTIAPLSLASPTPLVATTDYIFDTQALYLVRGVFDKGIGNVRLQYTAGYIVVPEDIDQATAELVAFGYRERDRLGANSKGVGPETISFITDPATKRVLQALDDWRNVVPM